MNPVSRYSEFSRCQIRLREGVSRQQVTMATDDSSSEPTAIWACTDPMGRGSMDSRRIIIGRPSHAVLGLSSLTVKSTLLLLQFGDARLNEKAPIGARTSDDFSALSFVEVEMFVWAKPNTDSITVYCDVGDSEGLVEMVLGDVARTFNSSISSAVFPWVNGSIDA